MVIMFQYMNIAKQRILYLKCIQCYITIISQLKKYTPVSVVESLNV